MATKTTIRVGRVYDDVGPQDGERICVDRVWPRGFHKDDPRVGHWFKKAAPSSELRKWYAHKPERFDEFVTRYEQELQSPQGSAAFAELQDLTRDKPIVTLVTATHDVEGSQAAVLAKLLDKS